MLYCKRGTGTGREPGQLKRPSSSGSAEYAMWDHRTVVYISLGRVNRTSGPGMVPRLKEVQMMERDERAARFDDRVARASTAAPVVLIGGLVLLLGAFLDWAAGTATTAAQGTTATVNTDLSGYNVPDGRIAAGIGLALALMGLLMWANKRVGSWFDVDLLGVALSAIAVGVIVTYLMDVGSSGRSADIGTYVSFAGAAIALIGAGAALLRSGSDRATTDREGRGDVGRRAAA